MAEHLKSTLEAGLTSSPKYIPTWYNYDEIGSELHHKYTTGNSGNNYFTRSQLSIIQDNIQDIIPRTPHGLTIVDLGSGNCTKTRLFIDELLRRQQKCSFYPVDISSEFLLKSVSKLTREYGDALSITPIPADYEQGIEHLKRVEGPKLILFFASIINLSYDEQVDTLRMISTMMTDECRLVFSADATQDRDVILKAYNDDAGQARTFLQNVITRLNREEGSQIDMNMFVLEVDFISDTSSQNMSYIRVCIQAKESVMYPIPGLGIELTMEKGERLYFHKGAGYSCKYTKEQLQTIVEKAGLHLEDTWTDEHQRAIFCRCKIVNDTNVLS
ncbi:uncharacterized protein LOC110448217 [Mizuhopecten yessoensis]|uniref:Histidine-specific methyltransferase EgtD n=1 Tax=Mizuhopecten yessoensis TaxID=6573 RepID=A0A210R5Q4_MIZYE|nr:uncharacterized protein LOC110448217 [Mizuhopecten yessoensis]OWF56373.1 Histidine-specific methyltransferase EgtD [Mizuhopecten yessoensis]